MKKGLHHNLVLVVTLLALDHLVPLDYKDFAAKVGFRRSALDIVIPVTPYEVRIYRYPL
jgi:hypothetical protein